MFGFFCRLDQLIEISRWVICNVTYQTIVWFATICMCDSNGTFIFSQEEEEKAPTKSRWWKQWPVAKKSTDHRKWPWWVKLCIGFWVLLTEYGCNEIIIVNISCLAAIMIGGSTAYGTTFLPTLAPTPRSIHMGQKTQGPCPCKVSHGSRCKVVLRRWWLYSKGGILQGV